jgi:hypothetical protein
MATPVFSIAKGRPDGPAPSTEVRDGPQAEHPADRQAPAVREYLREHIVRGYN